MKREASRQEYESFYPVTPSHFQDILDRHCPDAEPPESIWIAYQGNFVVAYMVHANESVTCGVAKCHAGDKKLVEMAERIKKWLDVRNLYDFVIMKMCEYIIHKYEGDGFEPGIGERIAVSRALQNRAKGYCR